MKKILERMRLGPQRIFCLMQDQDLGEQSDSAAHYSFEGLKLFSLFALLESCFTKMIVHSVVVFVYFISSRLLYLAC